MDKEKCGRFIRKKREELGLSKSELAEKLGVSVYDVDCWEAGFFPSAEFLLPLSAVLKTDVEELLTGEKIAEKTPAVQPPASQSDEFFGKAPAQSEESAPSVPPREEKTESPPVSASLSAKPPKKEKSYYEKLHEKMNDIDWENVAVPPSGENGFSDGERKFGKILCICFLVLVLITQAFRVGRYLTRDRELTLENYGKYLEIYVNPVGEGPFYSDLREYTVEIRPKTDIEDFSITVEVSFYKMFETGNFGEKYIYRDVSISQSVLWEGARAFRNLSFDDDVRDNDIKVKSVRGKLS